MLKKALTLHFTNRGRPKYRAYFYCR
jgi:hypothetical protein